MLQRTGQTPKNVGVADGEARPQGSDQLAFGTPPQVGDALYIGFEDPLDRLIIQIDIEASQARGAGVNPEDPPLRWEVSQGEDKWAPATVLEDLTGGFNYGSGTVELELPPRSAVAAIAGQRLHWLRCRITDTTASGRQGASYTHAPEIYSITAAPVGARLPATHASLIEREILGVQRRHARPDLPAAPPPGAEGRRGRDARGPGPGHRRLGALGVAHRLRRLDRSTTATSPSISSPARSSSARPSARRAGAGSSTAPCRPRARSCASRATATAAGATATSPPAR